MSICGQRAVASDDVLASAAALSAGRLNLRSASAHPGICTRRQRGASRAHAAYMRCSGLPPICMGSVAVSTSRCTQHCCIICIRQGVAGFQFGSPRSAVGSLKLRCLQPAARRLCGFLLQLFQLTAATIMTR